AALSVTQRNLLVQRPEVVEHAEEEQAPGAQVDKPADPLAVIHTVHTEDTEECQQDPGDVVVDRSGLEAKISLAIHRRNQEQVDDPADEEQPQGEEPDGSSDRSPIVEAVRSEKAEYPQQISDYL